MFRLVSRGSFNNILQFFNWVDKKDILKDLHDIGRIGSQLLRENTPVDTGRTAASWDYEIEQIERGWRVSWKNTNINKGVLVAVLIQYGHATGTGGYVPAIDYINPVMEPIFGKAADDLWEEVKKA